MDVSSSGRRLLLSRAGWASFCVSISRSHESSARETDLEPALAAAQVRGKDSDDAMPW